MAIVKKRYSKLMLNETFCENIESCSKKNKRTQEQEENEITEEIVRRAMDEAEILNAILVMEMNNNPLAYINLLKRKAFNPHLCNIAEDEYDNEQKYCILHNTNKQYSSALITPQYADLKTFRTTYFVENDYEIHARMKCKANFSLLHAILKNWIKEDLVTIMDCDRIFQRFGFRPVVIKTLPENQIIYELYYRLKDTPEYQTFMNQTRTKTIPKQKGKYGEFDFKGLCYHYTNNGFGYGIIIKTFGSDGFNRILKKVLSSQTYQKSHRENEFSSEEERRQNILQATNLQRKAAMDANDFLLDAEVYRTYAWTDIPLEDMTIEHFQNTKPILFETMIPTEFGLKYNKANSCDDAREKENGLPMKDALWKEYQKDFAEFKLASSSRDGSITIKSKAVSGKLQNGTVVRNTMLYPMPTQKIYLKLDDVADLPIDWSKIKVIDERELEEEER